MKKQISIPGPGFSTLQVTSSECWVSWTKPSDLTPSTSEMTPELISGMCVGETPKSSPG